MAKYKQTTNYYVKVEAILYYDRNYEIEADNELQASAIAKAFAKGEWKKNGNDADFRRDWEFGQAMHETIYVEEAY